MTILLSQHLEVQAYRMSFIVSRCQSFERAEDHNHELATLFPHTQTKMLTFTEHVSSIMLRSWFLCTYSFNFDIDPPACTMRGREGSIYNFNVLLYQKANRYLTQIVSNALIGICHIASVFIFHDTQESIEHKNTGDNCQVIILFICGVRKGVRFK